MRFLYTAYLILGVLIVFSSCSYKPSQVLFAEKAKTVTPAKPVKTAKKSKNNKNSKNVSDPVVSPTTDAVINTDTTTTKIVNYRIQPQDILEIRNLQNSKAIVDMNPPLSIGSVNSTNTPVTPLPETFQVEDDGTIAMTAIGRIKVAGLTRLEAMKFIEDMLKATEVKNPIIDIKITNLKVTVLGEVNTPGNFILTKDRTSLVEIIGAAGGLTDKANEKDIRIIRGEPGKQTEIKVNFSKLSAAVDSKAILPNNDLIVVSQNDKTVRAENVQVFTTVIQPVLIVLSALIVITTLIKR